ncbi:MAG TPA: glycosyltransferase family 39 protein [Candidatus Baltobacteraceae bacterium]|nr:glycosyltransferase family 39 protein [Candidatus Baltobacteraceae bacterium]
MRYTVALVLVLLLAAGLRVFHLSTVPTELIVDELDLYNSVSAIVSTGHDVDGTLKPFLWSQFTRNPPLYGVAGYASSLVFGKTPFGLRFPAALFGVAAVLCLYGLGYELTRRRDVALLAALFAAVQPIFVQFSRVAWEPSSELPFLLGGLYVLARTIRRAGEPGMRPFGGFVLSAALLSIACYTYMAAWFYALLLAGGLVLLNAKRLAEIKALLPLTAAAIIGVLIALPALQMIFLDPSTAGKSQRIATFAGGVSLQTLGVFARNYIAHFDLSYLVTTGDPQPGSTWRYLNGFGAFSWWIVPLALSGLIALGGYVKDWRLRLWLIVWLLAYPLGGALTNDGVPNAPRTLAGAPVFCLLAAIGSAIFLDWRRRWAGAALAIAVAVSTLQFSAFYFTRYVHRNSNAWDSGTAAMFAAVRAREKTYDRVCFSVWPAWYGIDTYVRFYLGNGMPTYTNIDDPACFRPRTLIVTDNDHHLKREGFRAIATIRDVNNAPFAILSARTAAD